MDELISIIVPIYNVEKYLCECLESIVNQTYSNLEIIIVNDGSTDGSLEIATRYKQNDKRIVIVDKKNEGLSVARQTGIDLCTGKYFVTVDSDDFIDEKYVSYLYEGIIKTNADIAICAKYICDNDGNRVKDPLLIKKDFSTKISERMLEKQYVAICGLFQMSDSWNKMYRTDFVKSSEVRFILPKEYNGTDLLFNHSLLLHAPVITTINEPLYYYRLSQNSRVRRKNKHLEIGFRIILNALLDENQKTSNSKKIANQIYAEYFCMIKYASLDYFEEDKSIKKKDFYNGIRDIINSLPVIHIKEWLSIIRATPPHSIVFTIFLLLESERLIVFYYWLRGRVKNL